MIKVTLKNGESERDLFNRFKKKVIRSRLLTEIKKRRWFVSKSEVRRKEKEKAIRRANRKRYEKENWQS